MRLLSRKEELILLAVRALDDNAYGVTIREHIKAQAGIDIRFGAIYTPLARLVDYGLVESYKSEPLNERGGRSRILYRITNAGTAALEKIRAVNEAMWSAQPDAAGGESGA